MRFLWLIRYPRALAVFLAIAAAFASYEGLDDAQTLRRFAAAKPYTARVVNVTQKSWLPPRWHAEVSWGEGHVRTSTGTMVVGAKRWLKPAVSQGDHVSILVAPDGPDPVILARRVRTSVLKFGGLEIGAEEFWTAVAFVAVAVLLFVFAGPIEREAQKHFAS